MDVRAFKYKFCLTSVPRERFFIGARVRMCLHDSIAHAHRGPRRPPPPHILELAYTYVRTYTHMHTYAHTHAHTHMHAHTYTYTYTYACVHMHVYLACDTEKERDEWIQQLSETSERMRKQGAPVYACLRYLLGLRAYVCVCVCVCVCLHTHPFGASLVRY
jgi:hypothetical protein